MSAVPPSAPHDIEHRLLHGIAWTGAAKWTTQALTWISTLMVARLVTPEDFGIIGSATLYLSLMGLLADFGVSSAIVTMRELDQRQVAQLNVASILFGLTTALLGLAVAAPIGQFFEEPAVTRVLGIMSATLLFAGVRTVPIALLQRDLQFRTIALMESMQAIVGAATSVTLAFAGFGYWALVGGGLAQGLCFSLLALARRRAPLAWPQWHLVRKPLQLGVNVLTAQLSWWIYSNADFAIAGRVLGQRAMGSYLLAWEFASLPVEKITNVVTRVTPAIFSAIQRETEALKRQLLLLSEGIATLTLPASIGLALVTPDFVHVVLGAEWIEAIRPLQILCLYVSLRSVHTLLPQILLVRGAAYFPARLGIVLVLAMPTSFYIGSHWGTTGIAMAWLLVYPIITLPLFVRVFRELHITVADYLGALRWPLMGTAVMALAVYALARFVASSTPTLAWMVAKIGVGALAYGLAGIWPQRERLRGFVAALRS